MPELTAERFPELDSFGRVYRTGDLVVEQHDGRLLCLGRIDSQVKVRGYRIELEAIEAVLANCDGVHDAVCDVHGEEPERFLVAHIVADDAASPPVFDELAAALREQLPEYMVPARFFLLDEVPRSVGGKVQRSALPKPQMEAGPVVVEGADGSIDSRVRMAFAAVLMVAHESLDDGADFFDLGGNSLRAAMLITRLRGFDDLASVTVRDVYTCRTAAALTEHLERQGAPGSTERASTRSPREESVSAFTCVQVAFLVTMLLGAAGFGYVMAFMLLPWLLESFTLGTFLLALPWVFTAISLPVAFAMLGLAVVAKKVLIGRSEPARVSAWSSLRLRHWIVGNLLRHAPWGWAQGTELQSVMLRLMGARVGRRVSIHRSVTLVSGGWDLLEIGDDVTIGREVDIGVSELDEGDFVLGRVVIGDGATMEVRSGTGSDVVIGARSVVGPLAFVPSGTEVPADERWQGVPAASVGEVPAPDPVPVVSSWSWSLLVLSLRTVLGPLLAMPYALLIWWLATLLSIDGIAVRDWLCVDGPSSNLLWFWVVVLAAVVALPYYLLQLALVLRWLPKTPVGSHARWSLRHWWMTTRANWLEAAGGWLSGTLFWPRWLRLAGMRVGRDVEVSTVLDVLPEHVAIGGSSFLADGVYLGVPHERCGTVTVAATSLGERTFLGNHVIVEGGNHMADDLLLGVSTIANADAMAAGSSWFGQPAFLLPRREVVDVDRRLTFEPGPLRYVNRLFWESLRFLLPIGPSVLALWWFDVVIAAVGVVLATFGYALVLALLVLVAKWLLLGRVRPGQHGLWSCWASRWDFHYVMWQRYGRALLTPFEGTLLLPWYLRAMGMRIGRRCVLGDGFAQVVDPDMITIEDGATVHALFQAHSFEDRVLKIDRVRLGAGSTVGKAAVVLYGADIDDGAYVMPHSVVMKRERLLPARRYAGVPSAEHRR